MIKNLVYKKNAVLLQRLKKNTIDMDRKTTIKVLRDITRKLSDEILFKDSDFTKKSHIGNNVAYSIVEFYIKNRLEL